MVFAVTSPDDDAISADQLPTRLAGCHAVQVLAVFVLSQDPLPRRATGKVLKRELRDGL